jgi:organic radical activating enzyme
MKNDLTALSQNGAFCPLPWIHDYRSLDGQKYMCCQSHSSGKTLSEDFNGPERHELRQRMWSGEQIPHCGPCYKMEANNLVSARQNANQEWLVKPGSREFFEDWKPGDPGQRMYYDLRYNSKCNLSCISCGPEFSSLWKKELNIPIIEYKLDVVPEQVLQSKRVYFAGGEPLIIDEYTDLLTYLANNHYPGHVSINTNLTSLRSDVLDAITAMPDISLVVSVDSWGRTEEYVRYPKQWRKFLDNLAILQERDIAFNFNTVCSSISVLGWKQMADLQHYRPKNWWLTPLEMGPQLRLENLPLALKEQAAENILSMRAVYHHDTDHKFQSSVNHLLDRLNRPGQFNELQKYIRELDTRRKINHADYLGLNLFDYKE